MDDKIKVEIDHDDCALVIHSGGTIDVYCPELDKASHLPNVRLLRTILVSLVKTVSESDDINELLEQINQHFSSDIKSTGLLH
jgi:hypothetical protein